MSWAIFPASAAADLNERCDAQADEFVAYLEFIACTAPMNTEVSFEASLGSPKVPGRVWDPSRETARPGAL